MADEPIVELETDKVNLEVPSPIDGVLTEISSKDGESVEVGALLGSISKNGNTKPNKNEIKKTKPQEIENNVVSLDIERKEPKVFEEKNIEKDSTEETALVLTNEAKEEKSDLKIEHNDMLSPAVRKIVVENKIDLEKVKGSGKNGENS